MSTELDRERYHTKPRTHRMPFTPLNVHRILNGPKRMTRGVLAADPAWTLDPLRGQAAQEGFFWFTDSPDMPGCYLVCAPRPGTLIAATEPYYQRGSRQPIPGAVTRTGRPKTQFVPADHEVRFECPAEPGWYYRHGRYMPARYSRMLARVTATKAERVQDITEADALLEGIYAETWGNVRDQLADPADRDNYAPDTPVFLPPMEAERVPVCLTAVEAFQHLWTSLYGDDPVKGWAANPWVAATTFEPVPTP